jgi:hypothetical protein
MSAKNLGFETILQTHRIAQNADFITTITVAVTSFKLTNEMNDNIAIRRNRERQPNMLESIRGSQLHPDIAQMWSAATYSLLN